MNRDDLVERVAEERHARRSTYVDGTKEVIHSWAHVVSQPFHAKYVEVLREDARAALAIIEPAVREECARVADAHAELYTNGSRQPGWGINVDAADIIAAAIRAGAKT